MEQTNIPHIPKEIRHKIIYQYQPRPEYINSLKWLFTEMKKIDQPALGNCVLSYVKGTDVKKHLCLKKITYGVYEDFTFRINGFRHKFYYNGFRHAKNCLNTEGIDDPNRLYGIRYTGINDGIAEFVESENSYKFYEAFEIVSTVSSMKSRENDFVGQMYYKIMTMEQKFKINEMKKITGDKKITKKNKKQKIWEHFVLLRAYL